MNGKPSYEELEQRVKELDPETHSINIDVPDEEKLACAEELSKKVDVTWH